MGCRKRLSISRVSHAPAFAYSRLLHLWQTFPPFGPCFQPASLNSFIFYCTTICAASATKYSNSTLASPPSVLFRRMATGSEVEKAGKEKNSQAVRATPMSRTRSDGGAGASRIGSDGSQTYNCVGLQRIQTDMVRFGSSNPSSLACLAPGATFTMLGGYTIPNPFHPTITTPVTLRRKTMRENIRQFNQLQDDI